MDDSLDFIVIEHHEDLDLLGDFTIALWVKPTISHSQYLFLKASDFGGGGGYSISYWLNRRRSIIHFEDKDYLRLLDDNVIPFNWEPKWEHLALTRQENLYSFYLNGQIIDSSDFPGQMQTSKEPLYIGTYYFVQEVKDIAFRGKMDDFRIYNRSLSKEDLTELINL